MIDDAYRPPRKVAEFHHEATDRFVMRIEFTRADGSTACRSYPRELCGRPLELERRLYDDGADLPASRPERRRLIERLVAQAAPVTGTVPACTGWRDDDATFVFSHRIVSAGDAPATLFLDPEW